MGGWGGGDIVGYLGFCLVVFLRGWGWNGGEFFFGDSMDGRGGLDCCFLFEKGREVLIWSLIECEVELGSGEVHSLPRKQREIFTAH